MASASPSRLPGPQHLIDISPHIITRVGALQASHKKLVILRFSMANMGDHGEVDRLHVKIFR